MNILKKMSVLMLTFAMLFTFSACGSKTDVGSQGESQGVDGEIVWDCQFLDSSSHPMIILMREWSDKLYEETDGRLKVNIRVGGELPFTTSEYLDAVSNGSIQMAGCMVTAISSYLQAGGLTSVPFLVTDVESYETVMDILNPYVDEELSSYGVFNALNLFYPTQDIYGSGATPSSYKDLQGLKLRTSGAEQAKFWQNVGLLPSSIDASEVSSALNTNVINGVTTATMAVEMNKWYESLDWVYMCYPMLSPVYTVVNQSAFDSLPSDVQEIFLKVCEEFNATFNQRMQDYSDQSLANLEELGLEVVYATEEERDELRAIAMPQWDEYASTAGGKAEEALAAIKTALGY